jgi:NAD+ synthase (glutamine-hydrolysing)
VRIALAQPNVTVGDIAGNVKKICQFYSQAVKLEADVVVFPELCISGYPPEDLLLKSSFIEDNHIALEQLAKDCSDKDIIVCVGFAEKNPKGFFNSLAVLQAGQIKKIYRKTILPNYGVFDEKRYFRTGNEPVIINIKGINAVLTICEDVWQPQWLGALLKDFPQTDIIINSSASPFHTGKIQQRRQVLADCARYFDCAVAYCNLVGGQDELVFDGRSMFLDQRGAIISEAKAFAEDLLAADIDLTAAKRNGGKVRVMPVNGKKRPPADLADDVGEIYEALVLGTRDYVLKNRFRKAIVSLSGGIDSSVTAAIAVDALGSENVVGLTMPSQFNSRETIRDAGIVAENLDIEFHTIPIMGILERFNETIGEVKGWDGKGVPYENLQARIRGTILMSLSNQFSYLVLTTGNKSEIAVGYSTLYGDTAGGFAVIKDVPKTMVYRLADYVNKIHQRQIIPKTVLERPPSAELKYGQKDTDSLPEYDLLDKALKGYIEDDKSSSQLAEEGLTQDVVERVIGMVDCNEYKRRQYPPGIKITPKAFGRDRRMPITNFYRR